MLKIWFPCSHLTIRSLLFTKYRENPLNIPFQLGQDANLLIFKIKIAITLEEVELKQKCLLHYGPENHSLMSTNGLAS
jgi:hypothetical protein